jgi:fructose-1,6-bisphosphatase/inositol monophosphatase family enzyme
MNELPFESRDAVEIVREAGRLALSLRGRYTPDVKADNTLVTQADREIEELLRGRLAAIAPGWAFLGEETGLEGNPDAPCWVIDPIDGTTNFVRGLPLWCVSVGAVHRGRAIWGGLAVPLQNEIFWAAEGAGAWQETMDGSGTSRRLRVADPEFLEQEDLIAANTTADSAVDFRKVPCRLRNLGSLAYHLTAAARGAILCALSRQHKLYDIAAGVCLCIEAGCEARYLDGRPWSAEVVAPREPMPLLVAPPHALNLLCEKLNLVSP